MEGGDGSHALDLVDAAPRASQRLSDQRSGRRVAEEDQSLRLGEANLVARDVGAAIKLVPADPGTGSMEAGERGAISGLRIETNRFQHPIHQLRRIAAERDGGTRVVTIRKIAKDHDRGAFDADRQGTYGTGSIHREVGGRLQPTMKLVELFGPFRSGNRRLDRHGHENVMAQPRARLLTYRMINTALAPPIHQAVERLSIQRFDIPTHGATVDQG